MRSLTRSERRHVEEVSARLTAEEETAKVKEEQEVWEALAAEQAETNAELLARLNTVQEAAQDEPIPSDVPLELNEAETRALIDSQLRDAGWQADTQRLRHRRYARSGPCHCNSGMADLSGPVDYALFLEERCVGLIEAKRDSTDVPGVLAQAMRYGRDVRLDPA